MGLRRSWLVLLSLTVIHPVSTFASILELQPSEPPYWVDVEPGRSGPVIARLEAVEDSLYRSGTALTAADHLTLARLQLRTGSREYRALGLEHALQAEELEPDLLEAFLVELQLRIRDDAVQPCLDRIERRRGDFAERWELDYAHGYYLFARARQLVDRALFLEARHAFLRAARQSEGNRTQRLALAAAAHLAGDREGVRAATGRLLESNPDDLPALLLRACGLVNDERHAEADELFRRALPLLADSVRVEFETAASFLHEHAKTREMEPLAYWRMVDERPTELWNPRQLRFWRRLVEADLLFGRQGQIGWSTATGRMWVQKGPPVATYYRPFDPMNAGTSRSGSLPALSSTSEEELGAPPLDMGAGWDKTEDEYLPMTTYVSSTPMEYDSHLWVWYYYSNRGKIYGLAFANASYGLNPEWHPSSRHTGLAEKLARTAPIFYPQFASPPTFALDVAFAGYLPGPEESVIETSVSIHAFSELVQEEHTLADGTKVPASYILHWALYDENDRRIDHREVCIDRSRLRSHLLAEAGATNSFGEALLWRGGARLTPGHYRVAVEVEELASGNRLHRVAEVDLAHRPRLEASMSDPSFVATFSEYAPDLKVAPEFVKHAVVLIPCPEEGLRQGAESVIVYYEIYDLDEDSTGFADFDVSYNILQRVQRDIRQLSDGKAPGYDLVPQSEVFTHERIAPSSQGVVVKGAEIELGDLERGDYELRVVVRDNRTGQRMAGRRSFRIVSKTELAGGPGGR